MTAWCAIDPAGPHLAIGCSAAENALPIQIPGCNYSKEDGIWRAPLTWAACVCFRTVWGAHPVAVSDALEQWASGQWAEIQARYQDRGMLDARADDRPGIRKLEDQPDDPHLTTAQRGGAAFLARWGRVILEDPMGGGKTPQLIRALQLTGGTPALIIAPGSALFAWRDKLAAWAPELSVRVVAGTAAKRHKAITAEPPADVLLVAWPNLRYHTRLAKYPGQRFVRCQDCGGDNPKTKPGMCEVHPKEFQDIKFRTVIADEAHRMQNARSKQTRAVWQLAHAAEFFYAATGTPVGDNVGQLWPIMHAIDPLAFPSRSRYLDLFAVKDYAWHGGTEILGIRPETEQAFHVITQPWMRRIPKELARPADAPRLDPEFRYPEMPPAQARPYAQMARELQADLAGASTVATNHGVKFARLCQLAGSAIEVADAEDKAGFTIPKVERALPSSKADDLLEFLEDTPGPLVVYCPSPSLIDLMEHKLHAAKVTTCKIVGGMSSEEHYQAAQWFTRGDCRVIFLSDAGGEAIDLQSASTIFFASPQPSYRKREQVVGRVDRWGQRNDIRTVFSLTPGTVETHLYELSCQKGERATAITRDADLLRWIISPDHAEPPEAGKGQCQETGS